MNEDKRKGIYLLASVLILIIFTMLLWKSLETWVIVVSTLVIIFNATIGFLLLREGQKDGD